MCTDAPMKARHIGSVASRNPYGLVFYADLFARPRSQELIRARAAKRRKNHKAVCNPGTRIAIVLKLQETYPWSIKENVTGINNAAIWNHSLVWRKDLCTDRI